MPKHPILGPAGGKLPHDTSTAPEQAQETVPGDPHAVSPRAVDPVTPRKGADDGVRDR